MILIQHNSNNDGFLRPRIPAIKPIVTKRLTLKAIEEKDAKSIFKIDGDRETAWWADNFRCHDIDDAIDKIAWGNEGVDILQYGIFRKDSDELIGYVQIKLPEITRMRDSRELGYAISKEHRRQGYMSEAVNAICNFLFQDETIRRITLEILPNNLPSLGVARKCGFVFVEESEEKKHRRFLDDKPCDLYALYRPLTIAHFAAFILNTTLL